MLIHKSNIDGKIKKEKGENQELIKEIKIKYDEQIDNYDEDLYDELLENVTNETVLDTNNTGGKY